MPTYKGGFQQDPFPDRYAALTFHPEYKEQVKLTIGIKTITHDRMGLKLKPHKTVVIEMVSDEYTMDFDLTPGFARALALKLNEFANAIDGD
jgi:hypothetical protein